MTKETPPEGGVPEAPPTGSSAIEFSAYDTVMHVPARAPLGGIDGTMVTAHAAAGVILLEEITASSSVWPITRGFRATCRRLRRWPLTDCQQLALRAELALDAAQLLGRQVGSPS
jgi:hypothetical protein